MAEGHLQVPKVHTASEDWNSDLEITYIAYACWLNWEMVEHGSSFTQEQTETFARRSSIERIKNNDYTRDER